MKAQTNSSVSAFGSLNPLRYLSKCPLFALRRLVFIAFGALLLGTIIPGFVAYSAGVFYESQIDKTLRNNPARFPTLAQNRAKIAELNAITKRADDALASEVREGFGNMAETLKIRDYYSLETTKTGNEYSNIPFFLSGLMFAWTALYTSLACLIFIFSPPQRGSSQKPGFRQALPVAAM